MTDTWSFPAEGEDTVNEDSALSDKDRIVITFKGDGNKPWIVLHMKDVDESTKTIESDGYKYLRGLVAAESAEFSSACGTRTAPSSPAAAPAARGGYAPKPAQSAPPQGAPEDTCPTHGAYLVYTGASTRPDGTTVSGRMHCPVDKCYQLTYWHNANGSWKKQLK